MAEITAAAAIEWVVSPVIEMVINKIGTFIEKKYFEKDSLEDDMKKMNTILLEILSTMAIVEKHRIVDPNQLLLVRQIKDAVYDAEDCMDDFNYELAKKENEKSLPNIVRRVTASCSRLINQCTVGNSSLKKKLKEVNKSLDQANRSAEKLLKQMGANKSEKLSEQKNQILTSSLLCEETFIGREEELALIIERILEEKAAAPTIIPIVGRGGLGKTTLAQKIFNDTRLDGHFESNQKMWLTVSDKFDKLELTKQMLSYLCESFSTSNVPYDRLHTKLQTELSSKKILLILDDVWYVKDNNKKQSYERDWLEFLAPLKNAKAGSTIIVTTREDLVVDTLNSSGSQISLNGLNDDDSWSLLKLKALNGENPNNLLDLEPIGREIVNKLKGLPLAIRVVGSRLRGKFDTEEWQSILEDDSLDKEIMEVLHRSYEHLPGYLRRCFAYCSLFPKDYYLKRDRLVHMWIAHEFVLPEMGKKLEDVGKSYFNELIARSFIQVINRNDKEYYVMHDLMNDLACQVSQGECYILKEGDTLKNLGSIRHLSIDLTDGDDVDLKYICGLDKLRTLIIFGKEVCLANEVFIKMKRIRVLDIDGQLYNTGVCKHDLGIYEDDICESKQNNRVCKHNVGVCKHLRYLCFRLCHIEPDSFNNLHLLTVLFIRNEFQGNRHIHDYYVLSSQSILPLSRLEFIDTSKWISMEIGGQDVQISSLWRGNTEFTVKVKKGVKKKEGWELGHLQHFNNIKGVLDIRNLINVASREEAIEAQLVSKKHVTKLRLRWIYWSRRRMGKKECNKLDEVLAVLDRSYWNNCIQSNEILEELRPHPNIQSLELYHYPGDKFPSWLSGMTYICIGGTDSKFEKLPALGQSSQLKKLCFSFIYNVSRIGDEFYDKGIFPSLEELEFSNMFGLEEWSFPSGVHSFPKLRRLELNFCRKIKSLPKLPDSLQELSIGKVHPDLMKFYGNEIFPSLEELYIEHMEGLEEWSSPCGVDSFPELRKLNLYDCPDLFSLPEMEYFCSLESVQIKDCPKIKSLPKLPVSLRDLTLTKIHPDLEEQLTNKNGLEWNKVTAVSGCLCVIYRDYRRVVLQEGE